MNRDPALRHWHPTIPGGTDPLFLVLGVFGTGWGPVRIIVCQMGRACIKTERGFATKGQAL
ncbi:hypothetical protein TH30_19005 [Thalassospira profundimaris]|uniref:Uncharacterized protein n=1 Tax=Thalassospira profundimaris TaxID=502049 RepID=A0A367WSH7_9PROT|nr:hypothetical protein TH30_19005 [Thalassospira profundimaris]